VSAVSRVGFLVVDRLFNGLVTQVYINLTPEKIAIMTDMTRPDRRTTR